TLVACAFVCRVWRIRALFHLYRDVWLPSRKHVASLSRHLRRHPDRQAPIEHVFIVKSSTDHLSTFAMMLARQLPSLRSLTLVDVDFRTARSLHAGSIRHLSAYPNMTRLELRFVAFETASQFASLLLALPHLRYLACHTV
ncbi:uncharacterized protein B0H18DRAFT_865863, partial [Fomitopsis serialis]|uniref:uncharacterized protein n=1 Tax=Fomitopsis serialis TaxID=139415 RepID=UPI0020078FA8